MWHLTLPSPRWISPRSFARDQRGRTVSQPLAKSSWATVFFFPTDGFSLLPRWHLLDDSERRDAREVVEEYTELSRGLFKFRIIYIGKFRMGEIFWFWILRYSWSDEISAKSLVNLYWNHTAWQTMDSKLTFSLTNTIFLISMEFRSKQDNYSLLIDTSSLNKQIFFLLYKFSLFYKMVPHLGGGGVIL